MLLFIDGNWPPKLPPVIGEAVISHSSKNIENA